MAARLTEGQTPTGHSAAELMQGYEILDEADQTLYAVEHFTQSHLLPATEGTLSAKQELTLPGNAVVQTCVVKVTATAAARAHAATIAELRSEPGDEAGSYRIVVDFGTVRTVSAAVFDPLSTIEMVEAWTGTEFPVSTWDAPFNGSARLARFRSEVRTERIRITVSSQATSRELMAGLYLVLPDSPKDLLLTINDGAPVWNLPGPAAAGVGEDLSFVAWNADGERLVDLTQPLADLTGDPLAPAEKRFDIVLTSREAGVLKIAPHEVDYAVVRRARFNGAEKTTLEFDGEGITTLPLTAEGTPAGAKALGVTFGVAGEFPAERRIPPVGPEPRYLPDGATPLAEIDITPQAAVTLWPASLLEMPVVTGLRLPLLAGPEGGELQLVAWSNAGPGLAVPIAPMDVAVGEPLVADAGSGPAYWQSLMLAEPLEMDPANPPWFALIAARGQFTIALSDTEGAVFRVGPSAGPWRPLPGLFASDEFATLRLPYRLIGEAADRIVTPPLLISASENAEEPLRLDPIKGGTRHVLSAGEASDPALRITHFTAGTLDIDTVDIVSDS